MLWHRLNCAQQKKWRWIFGWHREEGIIADEPTAHLDTDLAVEFMDIVSSLLEEGKTILIASHDPVVVEAGVIEKVVALRDGRITEVKGP